MITIAGSFSALTRAGYSLVVRDLLKSTPGVVVILSPCKLNKHSKYNLCSLLDRTALSISTLILVFRKQQYGNTTIFHNKIHSKHNKKTTMILRAHLLRKTLCSARNVAALFLARSAKREFPS